MVEIVIIFTILGILYLFRRKAIQGLMVSGVVGIIGGLYVYKNIHLLHGIYFILLGLGLTLSGLYFKWKNKRKSQKNRIILKDYLKSRIVGQDEALNEITRTLTKNLTKQEKTGEVKNVIGTFLFVGPTGVGKTETAKAIAEWFNYKYGHQFLSFDMGNFSDMNTASTLVGSPRGYIGSEEGGALTRPLLKNPKAVILFDEIEKGHPSLYKPLMRLVDEGIVQEVSTGVHARLSQGIIIFTSNLYQATIKEINQRVFNEIEREMLTRDVLSGKFDEVNKIVPKSVIEEDFKRFTGDTRYETKNFPQEFLGRIDKVIVFKPLDEQALAQIVVKILQKYNFVKNQEDISKNVGYIWELVAKYKPVADKYGVRVFIKKIEEEIL